MNFVSKEEIELPIEATFREITDFEPFERSAQRRGVTLRRTDDLPEPGIGMGWHARFTLRGHDRDMSVRLVEYCPPKGFVMTACSPPVTARMNVDLFAVSQARTRLSVDLSLTGQGLAGRLMMQPFKLIHATLGTRFRGWVAEYVRDIEDRSGNRA